MSLVALLNADGTLYANAFSDAQGFYNFPNLPLNRPFLVRSQFPGVPASVTTTTTPVMIAAH